MKTRKPPAKKAATKRTVSKKAAPKSAAKGAAPRPPAKKATASSKQAKFPRHPVEKSLRIPKAIYEQNGGRPATRAEAVSFAGGAALTGPWRVEMSSAQKYGFLEAHEAGRLALTERARRAIAPQSETDRVAALREAVQAAPDVSDVYNYYRGEQLPDATFFANALTDRFGIPSDKLLEFEQIFDESIRSAELLDETGPRPAPHRRWPRGQAR